MVLYINPINQKQQSIISNNLKKIKKQLTIYEKKNQKNLIKNYKYS